MDFEKEILKKENESLKEEVSHLRLILSLAPGNFYWKNTENIYQGCNSSMAKILDLESYLELIGKTAYDVVPEKYAYELEQLDKKIMDEKKEFVTEEIGFNEFKEECWYLTKKVPIYDKSGKVIGLIGTSIDITDRKKVEELNAQLEVEKERNKILKLLAGSISHELRTPLSTIYLGLEDILKNANNLNKAITNQSDLQKTAHNINQLKNYLNELEDLPKDLIGIISNCQKIINMQLKNIAVDEAKIESTSPHQIKDVIEKAISSYPYKGKQKILINTDFSACDDFTFMGNDQQMMHVFWNLIKNALYYIEAAGKGEIFIRLETSDDFNMCLFKDTGTGMTEDIAKNVFKQFFTRRTNGTGLGLSFCDLVMKSCGGKILCDSKEGKFTQFTLLFPKI